ncbi:MAG: hypothetical protein IPG94_20960 [Kineosporiaceae bacterium]|nr:hypothetical protein [Kineosporiaceae bacterium]
MVLLVAAIESALAVALGVLATRGGLPCGAGVGQLQVQRLRPRGLGGVLVLADHFALTDHPHLGRCSGQRVQRGREFAQAMAPGIGEQLVVDLGVHMFEDVDQQPGRVIGERLLPAREDVLGGADLAQVEVDRECTLARTLLAHVAQHVGLAGAAPAVENLMLGRRQLGQQRRHRHERIVQDVGRSVLGSLGHAHDLGVHVRTVHGPPLTHADHPMGELCGVSAFDTRASTDQRIPRRELIAGRRLRSSCSWPFLGRQRESRRRVD